MTTNTHTHTLRYTLNNLQGGDMSSEQIRSFSLWLPNLNWKPCQVKLILSPCPTTKADWVVSAKNEKNINKYQHHLVKKAKDI